MSQSYTPSQLTKGVLGTFFEQLSGERASLVDRIATRVPSSANSETYPYLGDPPQMEELVDELKISALIDSSYTLDNVDYVSGIAFRRRDVMDEQSGGIAMRIKQLASVAARHPNKLLIQALIDGDSSTLGLDHTGEAFFTSTHAARASSGTGDNIIAGTGTSTAQVAADFNSAFSALMGFKQDNGDPWREELEKVAVVSPTGNMKPMKETVKATKISDTDNVQLDGISVDLVFTARLDSDDANDWYMLDVGSPVRPLIFQDREPLTFVALDRDDTETAFKREQYQYKARATYAVGYSLWQNALKVTNT
jgi:phage major head subunit gpT-like protein